MVRIALLLCLACQVRADTTNAFIFLSRATTAAVTLAWDPSTSTNVAYYALYQATTPAGPWILAGSTSGTNISLTLGPGSYWFEATAVGTNGTNYVEGAPSGVARALLILRAAGLFWPFSLHHR